ncbi:MAG: hypothetical protein Q7U28_13140 [Aquabacterium sp.]|nr:hypothetical protein [Aquabacterium sp.]
MTTNSSNSVKPWLTAGRMGCALMVISDWGLPWCLPIWQGSILPYGSF